ncbi:hypothetical protein CYLTODRAFT_421025 [Cylindrobasidium torrendii FP15055 ss-10]|uniref:Zn(2)-C6 fungal-type domain-containing protein n=1 Tax=Cylindrobasidium torrendii FP15055 ss-10 TaxID=1314674 RepID=A0A0D7BFW7_9AGAR|nr:hypothetical protein CYLTODRAFT_421025 [Cylindrobasidium torrendii FP15055 ss-10]
MNPTATIAFPPSGSGTSSPSSISSAAGSPRSLPTSMVPAAPRRTSPALSSTSSEGTRTSAQAATIRRNGSAGKGGCWTCRLRRKKCDEQREGDTCLTCKRLTIECLGWGAKRPDWMRDKQAVEAYKADIKAKLTRAGLIRGQPRTTIAAARASERRSPNRATGGSRPRPRVERSHSDLGGNLGMPSMATGISPLDFKFFDPATSFDSLPNEYHLQGASYSDPNLSSMDFGGSLFPYVPQSSSINSEPGLDMDSMDLFATGHESDGFDFNVRPPSPVTHIPLLAGQTSIQEEHVRYFFENVRTTVYRLGGHALTNATYSIIVQDPRGALTNAVCAISSLHFTRMRVAQGLEAPDPHPEHSTAQSFHDEACFQISSSKQAKGCYDEGDVIAALHLISYGQLAGNGADYDAFLSIALDWISQTGLPTDDNPKLTLFNTTPNRQLAVKLTMWLDIFSSFSSSRMPRYVGLYKRLLADDSVFWGLHDASLGAGIGMDAVIGCPDEALLCLVQVSALAHWKMSEQRKGTLSVRDLLRRADDLEQSLRNRKSSLSPEVHLMAPLQRIMGPEGAASPSHEQRGLVGDIFRETALLYLHTVINDMRPGAPEISAGVMNVMRLLQNLAPSEFDRNLTFPICLAGCMSDESTQRDMLKARLQAQNDTIGNLLRTRAVMEAVWQSRDTRGCAVDWKNTLRERCTNLLLI